MAEDRFARLDVSFEEAGEYARGLMRSLDGRMKTGRNVQVC